MRHPSRARVTVPVAAPGGQRCAAARKHTHAGATLRLAAVALTCTMLGVQPAAEQAQQTPEPQQAQEPAPLQFGARAELVLVDVSVTDRNSAPVTDLSVADFDLEVNGQSRPIASAQFISTLHESTDDLTADAGPSSNDAPTSGRLMLFVIDDGHIRVGGSQAIVRTSEMLLDQLAPGDLVGVARLPTGAGSVEFTTDRRRVREALSRVAGSTAGPINMSQLQISEAYALETGDTDTWQRAVVRECANFEGIARESCADALQADARTSLTDATAKAMQTLRYMEVLFGRLSKLGTPVHVVMISEGLFLGRMPIGLTDVSRLAAEARVTLHIVRPAQSLMGDASRAVAPGQGYSMDDYLMREGLEQLAGQTRGRLLQVAAGTGAGIFERLNRELSGYYLLGFEPSDADRTGRQRRIRVRVRRNGLTVRARPTFALTSEADAASAPAADRSVEETLRDLLASPLPDRSVPLRVTTYNSADDGNGQVRVIVAAEVGENVDAPADWHTGILVLDRNDKVAAGHVVRLTLSPATPRASSPALLQTTVLLDPGEYTLRLAVADETGRTGSVHHTIRAGLTRMGTRQAVTDLLVGSEPTAPDPVRLLAAPSVDTERVSFQVAVAGSSSTQLTNTAVALEIVEREDGPPLASVNLPLARRDDTLRTFSGSVRLGLIPPGQYLARAVITAPGAPETRVARVFHYSPIDAGAVKDPTEEAPPLSVDDEVPPPPPPRIAVRLPRFDAATVLAAPVVHAFLDSLEAIHEPSDAARAVLERAREGRYDAPEPNRNMSAGDETTFAFVRGLASMQKQQYAQAHAWFQVALKSASDFLGSAFYIGACHAASGRDHDAVGAWQIALLSDAPELVYPPLVDGLLRVGDGLQALVFLDEAPDAWTDAEARDERQATAEAMTGAYAPALEKLHQLLDRRQDDMDLLYLALQVMYRVRQENGALSSDDRDRFVDYAARYAAAKGPQAALVDSWLRYVSR